MRIFKIAILCLSVLIFTASCREFYEPEVLEIDFGFLVAEGFVEVGGGTSVLMLGRSTTLYAEESMKIIDNARVILTGSISGSWQYTHIQDGRYELDENLMPDQDYQLQILIGEGEKYESEWLKPVMAPPIDRVFFNQDEDGVFIYLDSQGDGNYFLWTTEETWEFNSWFNALYKYDHDLNDMVPREENINLCYKSERSDQIILGSSLRSTDGSIKGLEVMRISPFSEKLGLRYSIEVWQRPLDQRAYEFWESLRKNTEDVGDIFGPMPSYIGSNIKRLDNEDSPVIGFISAGKSDKKRIFIEFTEVRPWPVRIPDYSRCTIQDTIRPSQYSLYFTNINVQPGFPIFSNGRIIGWSYTSTACVDCRLRGTTVKPDFWD